MKKILIILFLGYCMQLNAQSSLLSPTSLRPPSLSYEEILALPSPLPGSIVFDNTFEVLRVYKNSKWGQILTTHGIAPASISAWKTGGVDNDYSTDIDTDANGNVYITGSFYGTSVFGATNLNSAGEDDIFIAKYNRSGSLQWVQKTGGTGSDAGSSVTVDNNGDSYITGYFSGTVNFGIATLNSSGDIDMFVAKYNTNGVIQWVKRAGGSGYDFGNDITVDISGNVHLTGSFTGSAGFSGTTLVSAGDTDIFMAKYNSGGTLQWAQRAGGTGNDQGRSIDIDNNGLVYVTGSFSNSVNFSATNLVSAGNTDGFTAKYNPGTVSWVWAKKAGGTSYDYGRDLILDPSGNVYVLGSFFGSANFDNTITLNAAGTTSDIFLAKYNNNGAIQWVRPVTGTDDKLSGSLAMDTGGNVYVTGGFQGSLTFTDTNLTSVGSYDIFVAKYSPGGTVIWLQQAGGSDVDIPAGIAVDNIGNVFVTGEFNGTATFGATTLTSSGNADIVIMRIVQ